MMLPLAEVDMEVFNVRDYGALGDGVTDDTAAIQMAIDAASQAAGTSPDPEGKGGIVYIPPGPHIIRAPLVVTGQAGLKLVGSGLLQASKVGLSHHGPRTSLIWDPGIGVDDVLLHLKGCSGMTIRDIAFYGSLTGVGAVKLVRIEDLTNQPSLMNTFCRTAFIRAAMGVEADGGSGESHFEHVAFDHCTTGFKTTGQNSANWLFRHLVGSHTETVIDMEEGGCLDAHLVVLLHCGGGTELNPIWCFKFGGGGEDVRCSRLSMVHAEQVTKNLAEVVGDHRIAFDSLHEGGDCDCRVYLDSGAITFRSASFGKPRSISTPDRIVKLAANSRNATIRFRDALFNYQPPLTTPFDPTVIFDSIPSGCYYSFERCDYHYLNRPFTDAKNAW